jgi:hypothetical protein
LQGFYGNYGSYGGSDFGAARERLYFQARVAAHGMKIPAPPDRLTDDLEVLYGFRADLETHWPTSERIPTLSQLAPHPDTARNLLREAVARITAMPPGLKTNTDAPEELRSALLALTGLGAATTTSSAERRRLAVSFLHYDAESFRTTRQGRAPREHLACLAAEVAGLAVERGSATARSASDAMDASHPKRAPSPWWVWFAGRTRTAGLGVLLIVVVAGVAAVLATSSGGGPTPARPMAVDAETGKLVPEPRTKPPEIGTAQLGGGQALYVCDLTTQRPCPNGLTKPPVSVHFGDLIQLSVLLHNGFEQPLPVFRVYMDFAAARSYPISASVLLRWPQTSPANCVGSSCGDEASVFSTPVTFAVPGVRTGAFLRYVRGSTELKSQTRKIADLPDGITSYPGLLMANLGVPSSVCFDCRQDFTRWVSVKARVVR